MAESTNWFTFLIASCKRSIVWAACFLHSGSGSFSTISDKRKKSCKIRKNKTKLWCNIYGMLLNYSVSTSFSFLAALKIVSTSLFSHIKKELNCLFFSDWRLILLQQWIFSHRCQCLDGMYCLLGDFFATFVIGSLKRF